MMDLESAIKHCEEVAERHDRIKQIKAVTLEECKCAEEHRQLAAWLRELKAYRDKSQESDDENCDDILESIYAERDGKKMNGSFELTLNNPLTKEDWNKIMDVELENTPSVTFKTPKGKEVKYIKADILDKIRKEIQRLRGCSCSCSDGIIDDVEDILDKYEAESEGEDGSTEIHN